MKRRILFTLLTSFLMYAVFFDLSHVSSIVSAVTSGWAVSGDDVYFNDGNVGIGNNDPLSLVHVSNRPSNPIKISEIYDEDGEFSRLNPTSISIRADGLLAAIGGPDVTLIDYSDPTNPDLLSEVYDGDGEFSKLAASQVGAISGNYIYIASEESGGSLTIMDISDPTNPDLQSEVYDGDGEFDYLDSPEDILVVDNYVYYSARTEGKISIIDVSDPTDPDYVSKINSYVGVQNLAYDDDHLYVAVNDCVEIYDISSRTSPVAKDSFCDGATFTKLWGVRAMSIQDDILYVTAVGDDAVTIVDVSNKSSASLLAVIYDGDGTFSKLDQTQGITVYRNTLAATSKEEDAVTFVDITDPSNPTLIAEIYDGDGTYNYLNWAYDIVNDGEYIYVGGNGDLGITTIGNVLEEEVFSVQNTGKVGIGTLNPISTLDINGFMKLEINSSAPITCDSSTEGSIAVSSNHYTCICDGSSWVKTSDGSTSCTW